MKSNLSKEQIEQGRAIAQGMRFAKIQHEKNMAKAEKRTTTMLENQAIVALSGGVIKKGVKG